MLLRSLSPLWGSSVTTGWVIGRVFLLWMKTQTWTNAFQPETLFFYKWYVSHTFGCTSIIKICKHIFAHSVCTNSCERIFFHSFLGSSAIIRGFKCWYSLLRRWYYGSHELYYVPNAGLKSKNASIFVLFARRICCRKLTFSTKISNFYSYFIYTHPIHSMLVTSWSNP